MLLRGEGYNARLPLTDITEGEPVNLFELRSQLLGQVINTFPNIMYSDFISIAQRLSETHESCVIEFPVFKSAGIAAYAVARFVQPGGSMEIQERRGKHL